MHNPPRLTYAWWIVLCLVGLDYFSSLAYLPSIATTYAPNVRDLAPLAGVGVVLITLFAALPVYSYVIGRSPNGQGGIGLLAQVTRGWSGKLLVLALLGFVATDFILTRTLSVSDAATHLLRNSYYQEFVPDRAQLMQSVEGIVWAEWLLAHLNEQLVITIILSIGAFGFYHYLIQRLSDGFVGLAVGVVGVYLLVNLIVIGSGVLYLAENAHLLHEWRERLLNQLGEKRLESGSAIGLMFLLALKTFPPMAIGLSGFELTMAAAPTVEGGPADSIEHPRSRIRRTRVLMFMAAFVMSILVLGANLVSALLIEPESLYNSATDSIDHRALAYLAHGGLLADRNLGASVNPLFGPVFGSIYDLSTILILCLAGAGATISMRDIVPEFLSRFGMQLAWAHRIGAITHLLNGVILLVTIAFKASVTAQLWAYATSVLALLLGASLAAYLDLRNRWAGRALGYLVRLPFLITTLVFLGMVALIVYQQPVGVGIALLFVAVILTTAIASRWMRSTELRFEGFDFVDESSRERWERIRMLNYQAIVPHDPLSGPIDVKEQEIRAIHRIGSEVSIIFVEVSVGDPSDFFQKPRMTVERQEGRDIIRVTHATSVAHVIAAIGLEFRAAGKPPEFYFKWSSQHPMEATLNFLLLGQGNIPFLVRTLVHRAERNPTLRPRVIVADG